MKENVKNLMVGAVLLISGYSSIKDGVKDINDSSKSINDKVFVKGTVKAVAGTLSYNMGATLVTASSVLILNGLKRN